MNLSFNLRGSPAMLTGGILLLVGLGLVAVATFQFYQDRRFAQEGLSTQGTVLKKIIDTSTRGTGTDRVVTKEYEVTYQYTVEGTTLEGRDELDQDDWEDLAEGSPIEVQYLRSDPSSSRLAGPRPWFLNAIFGIVGLAAAVFGGLTLARGVRDQKLETRLRQHGVAATGTVTELRALAVTINDEQQWRLRYEFQDFQGHRHVNSIDMPEDEGQELKVGDTGNVRYDSSKPAEAVWLGREQATNVSQ